MLRRTFIFLSELPIWGLKLTMWMISNNFWRQKFSTFFHFGGLPRIPISHNSKNHLFKLFHRSQFSIFLPWPGSFRRLDFAHTRINRLLAISIPQRLCRFFPKKSTFWVFGEFPSHTFFSIVITPEFLTFLLYILKTNKDFYSKLYKHIWPPCKTPEAGTAGCTRMANRRL